MLATLLAVKEHAAEQGYSPLHGSTKVFRFSVGTLGRARLPIWTTYRTSAAEQRASRQC
jgi:hypothetical protein